jgi:hypothetical protein
LIVASSIGEKSQLHQSPGSLVKTGVAVEKLVYRKLAEKNIK